MIATVTLNPAVDYTVSLSNNLSKDAVNRTTAERITPGGKGINVSVILHRLGIETVMHGFLAGLTGQLIAHAAAETGIPSQWLYLHEAAGANRINMKLMDPDGVTEINGSGVSPSPEDLTLLNAALQSYTAEDIIVLAGSMPQGVPKTFYGALMKQLSHTGVQFAVDAEGEALLAALPHHPLIIKPNLPELCALFDRDEIYSDAELQQYAERLQTMGARNVLISLGGDGAMLLTEQGDVHRMAAPRGKTQSTVGAGDSMLAGFLAGYAAKRSPAECLCMGIAAGSATAFCEWLADADEIQRCLQTLPSFSNHP